MKKAKKQIMDIVTTSMTGAGGSLALGSIGGTAATHGQQGISNAMRFVPVAGHLVGTGMVLKQLKKFKKY